MVSGATWRAGGVRIRPILPLILALALAGCFAEEPVESGAVDDPSVAAPADATDAADALPEESAPPVLQSYSISFSGKTATSLCAPGGPNTCAGPDLAESENTFVKLAYRGMPRAVAATLTWTAASPATSEMYLTVFAVTPCGDQCYESSDESFFAYASGASPLTLSASDVQLAEGEVLATHVGVVDPTPRPPPPVHMNYGVEQTFTVEGEIMALVDATA